ncbi:hypothetical protein GBA65_02765 [Rubrobacter marinus]|uniref:Uncharacterized protein n=1 Tax=Rubrobacter marinus TaxID=2653852 RepID=A0A6G8PUD6_9ACTN|nr:hypothetical protein [Rubrobacter marinus]QIN77606.1 hypothetical protein GBA65_02765 [Rubrobacter marinus]
MSEILANPVVLLLLLLLASALVRRFLMGEGDSPVPSGAIVMAGGIFVIGALGRLGLPEVVGRLVVLELLVVWGFLALSYARLASKGGLSESVRQPMSALGIGTWVAGSAVLGRAILQVLPEWRLVGLALWVVAVVVWLWYLRLLPAAFRAAAGPSEGYRANGAILLSTVATQSLVVAGSALVPGGLPRPLMAALIVLGYLFYAAGLVLIARRYGLRSDWTLADDWDNTNCIIHGAMSITGLAIVASGALPPILAVLTWVWVVATFVVVEALEAVRALVRVRAYGWGEGLSVYNPTQWSRNFTYGMLYGFTLQLAGSPSAPDGWATGLQEVILSYGQYVVLALLLAEIVVFFYDRIETGQPGEAARGSAR